MTVTKTPISSADLNRGCLLPSAGLSAKKLMQRHQNQAMAPFPHTTPKELPIKAQISTEMFPWWSQEKSVADLERDMSNSICQPVARAELCPRCNLPVGAFGYVVSESDNTLMHGECKAQLVLLDLKAENEARAEKAATFKKNKRNEYGIGWKTEMIPRNMELASALSSSPLQEGMSCLRMTEEGNSVEVASTMDPTASLNLEYLSFALQVRRLEGREPLFSLDPREDSMDRSSDPDSKWQVKRFEPEWLEGTSVGEVMFQADIYLKELSMGEYDQPVVGMKSCFDYYEDNGMADKWNAREWFIVKQAEIQMSETGVLFPAIKMGVEAREQIQGPFVLEDKELTRPDHPLVKYAEEFTRNFDLIAERKSSIYHLRELAKACALAKFLEESVSTSLQQDWFEPIIDEKVPCSLEVPQLWNERFASKITVDNGRIVDTNGVFTNKHGVYGGVDFGLDKALAAAAAAPAAPLKRSPVIKTAVQTSVFPALRGGPQTFSLTPAAPAAPPGVRAQGLLSAALRPTVAPAVSAAALSATMGAAPQGVDMNLDDFNLSSTTQAVEVQGGACSWGGVAGAGRAFWSNLDSSESEFDQEDKCFLKGVFNPYMSDRREEGDMFTPPDASQEAVQELKSLLQKEAKMQEKRKDHFYGKSFTLEDPGQLFPHSWTNSVGIMSTGTGMARKLQARPDYHCQMQKIQEVMQNTMPVFDKQTEDGMRFRVYQVGSLEVRTTQEHDGKEVVGAVYSSNVTA